MQIQMQIHFENNFSYWQPKWFDREKGEDS